MKLSAFLFTILLLTYCSPYSQNDLFYPEYQKIKNRCTVLVGKKNSQTFLVRYNPLFCDKTCPDFEIFFDKEWIRVRLKPDSSEINFAMKELTKGRKDQPFTFRVSGELDCMGIKKCKNRTPYIILTAKKISKEKTNP